MISVQGVSMDFPLPRAIRDCLFRPLGRRKQLQALKGIDLEIGPGDRIALFGPNGAGKSTLLKLIGGQLLPTRGSISLNGKDTARRNTEARQAVGFVMNEERSFFWRLTGRQNLVFFGTLDNLFGSVLYERIETLLELVGLSDAADKPFSGYSSGMKQRLAMARGLLANPDVLILDEPTRTLDPIACDDLIAMILDRIHMQHNKTLLIATHRFDEAKKLCEKVMVLHQGRLLAFDRLETIESEGQDLAGYYRDLLHQVERAPC